MSEHWAKIHFLKYDIEVLQTTQGGISGTGIIMNLLFFRMESLECISYLYTYE